MDMQQADRLKALWKSGREKYLSFYAVLEEVRKEIGNEALPAWCRDNLQIGISVIAANRGLLTKVDADIVKTNLAAAMLYEKAQARRAREDEAFNLNKSKLEHAKVLAEQKLDVERSKQELFDLKTKRSRKKKDEAPLLSIIQGGQPE